MSHETPPPPSARLMHPRYRPDIDGLRAVAVLSVVAFHAFPGWLTGGFVGVDVFFVISGFLISSIIFQSLELGRFSFAEFYARRIRRIFPALLVVLTACLAFGWFALLSSEYRQLGKHVAAGAGFVSNLVLWGESGYFDAAAEAKPLLHLWSLGIEEQFYIAWPLLLWVAWKRRFDLLTITAAVGGISFVLNLARYQSDGVADFYSPQTRFWELLAGSIIAHMNLHSSERRADFMNRIEALLRKAIRSTGPADAWASLRNLQSMLGGMLIAGGALVIAKDDLFPGLWALVPVAGAMLVIAAGPDAWLNRVALSHPVLVWFGLISFPLYLWHWPLLALIRIVEGRVPDEPTRATAVLASIVLAWITCRLVEHPLRFGKNNRAIVISLVASMAALGYAGHAINQQDGLPFRASVREIEKALGYIKWRKIDDADPPCQKRFRDYPYCKLANDGPPTVALIGDSFANSYFWGLSNEYAKTDNNLVMLGAGGCPPLIDITSGFSGQPDWCKSMSSNAIKEVARLESIHTVILAANWHLYIQGTRFHQRYDRRWEIQPANARRNDNAGVFSEQMEKTLHLLADSGKRIIVMKQTPELNIHPEQCLIKRPFAFLKHDNECKVPAAAVRAYLAEYERIFDAVVHDGPRVRVLNPYPILCPDADCRLIDGMYPIYRDDLHLSLYGSGYLASRLAAALAVDAASRAPDPTARDAAR